METTIQLNNTDTMSMNGDNGLLRSHWAERKKKQSALQFLIFEQTRNKHLGKVNIHFIRRSVKLQDWDNCVSNFKLIGDALKKNGVIKDDSPEIIVSFQPFQEKVKHFDEQKTIIKIYDL